MGNTRSVYEESEFDDIWWTNGTQTTTEKTKKNSVESEPHEITTNILNKSVASTEAQASTNQASSRIRSEKLDVFKMELQRKHEKRRELIAEKRKELEDLRNEFALLKKENEEFKKENEELKQKKPNNDMNTENANPDLERLRLENESLKAQLAELKEELQVKNELCEKNRELKIDIAEMQTELQKLNHIVVTFEKEKADYEAHVTALKDVIKVSKQMLLIRETQLNELRQKIEEIEKSLAERELDTFSQDLRAEYQRQLQNIRNLRSLYEERQRADSTEKARLKSVLDTIKEELEQQKKLNSDHEERIEELEKENSDKYYEIKNLESDLGLSRAESREYQAELAVINQLFSQILISFNNNQEIDLDKLIKLLEENHDLLKNIVVNEMSPTVSSALPKVLLDLVNRMNENNVENQQTASRKSSLVEAADSSMNKLETIEEESESQTTSLHQLNSPEEIVENLPKVWRVLIELLSHQCAPVNIIGEEANGSENPCYKLVETPKGPNLVLSVSQTFIRLKDLILEKKSLEKELGHLKHLNTHLETRLQDQGKRLEMVSDELSKTWHVVGKLQKEHQVLHTQEQILRYELAQKRKLLKNLKEELESGREKWLEAREKNSNTEKQWKQLRTEFASRKSIKDDYNNSVESGYSDERECSSSDDEPGYETDISESNPIRSLTDENNDNESSEEKDLSSEEQDNNLTCVDNPAVHSVDSEDQVNRNNDNSGTPTSDLTEEIRSPETESCEIMQPEAMTDLFESTSHSDEQLVKTDLVQNGNEERMDSEEVQIDIPDSQEEVAESSSHYSADVTKPPDDLETEVQNITSSDELAASIQPTGLHSSESNACQKSTRTLEEILAARDERLRRMEGQCQQLVSQVTNTTHRSIAICNRLEDLHEAFGESSSSSQSATGSQSCTESNLDNSGNNENQE